MRHVPAPASRAAPRSPVSRGGIAPGLGNNRGTCALKDSFWSLSLKKPLSYWTKTLKMWHYFSLKGPIPVRAAGKRRAARQLWFTDVGHLAVAQSFSVCGTMCCRGAAKERSFGEVADALCSRGIYPIECGGRAPCRVPMLLDPCWLQS